MRIENILNLVGERHVWVKVVRWRGDKDELEMRNDIDDPEVQLEAARAYEAILKLEAA